MKRSGQFVRFRPRRARVLPGVSESPEYASDRKQVTCGNALRDQGLGEEQDPGLGEEQHAKALNPLYPLSTLLSHTALRRKHARIEDDLFLSKLRFC